MAERVYIIWLTQSLLEVFRFHAGFGEYERLPEVARLQAFQVMNLQDRIIVSYGSHLLAEEDFQTWLSSDVKSALLSLRSTSGLISSRDDEEDLFPERDESFPMEYEFADDLRNEDQRLRHFVKLLEDGCYINRLPDNDRSSTRMNGFNMSFMEYYRSRYWNDDSQIEVNYDFNALQAESDSDSLYQFFHEGRGRNQRAMLDFAETVKHKVSTEYNRSQLDSSYDYYLFLMDLDRLCETIDTPLFKGLKANLTWNDQPRRVTVPPVRNFNSVPSSLSNGVPNSLNSSLVNGSRNSNSSITHERSPNLNNGHSMQQVPIATFVNATDHVKLDQPMLKYSTLNKLKDHLKYLQSMKLNGGWHNLMGNITDEVKVLMQNDLLQDRILKLESGIVPNWTYNTFDNLIYYLTHLVKRYDNRLSHGECVDFMYHVKNIKFQYDPKDNVKNQRFELDMDQLYNHKMTEDQRTPANMKRIIDYYLPQIRKSADGNYGPMLASFIENGGLPINDGMLGFILKLKDGIKAAQDAIELNKMYSENPNLDTGKSKKTETKSSNSKKESVAATNSVASNSKKGKKKRQGEVADDNGNKKQKTNDNSTMCEVCGRGGNHHDGDSCGLIDHPDANKAYKTKKFVDTEAYKELMANSKAQFKCLSYSHHPNGAPLDKAMQDKLKQACQKASKKGTLTTTYLYNCDHISGDISNYTIPCCLCVNVSSSILTHVLLDTGSLQVNFLSKETAERIKSMLGKESEESSCKFMAKEWEDSSVQSHLCTNCLNPASKDATTCKHKKVCSCSQTACFETQSLRVCSAFNQNCRDSTEYAKFQLQIYNELTKSLEPIELQAFIIDTPYDVIIGKPSICKYDLLTKLPSFFSSSEVSRVKIANDIERTVMCAECCIEESRRFSAVVQIREDLDDIQLDPHEVLVSYLNSLTVEETDREKDEIDVEQFDSDDELEEILTRKSDHTSSVSDIDLIYIDGTDIEFRNLIYQLCLEFSDIFSRELRPEPAMIEPMHITLKTNAEGADLWRVNRNRGPARLQSVAKQKDLLEQVTAMQMNNIVRECDAAYYSQVLLVPKPDGTWRFCVDYRPLNEETLTISWPIPIIDLMLQRISHLRPRYFGTIDLTKGYYQAPLDESSQLLTAFITYFGVFHWLRVPMGLKGAPAYFQRVMSTVVLAGLIYIVCELYMDDVLIYATDKESYLNNLRSVFERFRKYKLTINPKKCKLGLTSAEFVGHTINSESRTFSVEKKRKVLEFPLPKNTKGLRSFIGLLNWFRDHIQNHSMKVRPLQLLLDAKSPKHKQIEWTPELIKIFEDLKVEVSNCPALYYVDESAPIYLHTDASDYGIGAYLYQLKDGKERPIRFLSKSLSREQLNWAVPEKECYAIVFALKKWDYLLRDVKFILRTDHKNLTYISTAGSSKVIRWKLLIQEFNFDIEYLPGLQNVVADAMSRLCSDSSFDEPSVDLMNLDTSFISTEQYELIASVHNEVAGHHGVERTLVKLEQLGHHWFHIRDHVKSFIKHCPFCQKTTQIAVSNRTKPFTVSTMEPMECLNIDYLGPFPDGGHILVIIDCFTRFIELYHVTEPTAEATAKALLHQLGRYGAPSQIKSDNGPHFVNKVIEELLKLVGVHQVLTLAYSKEENALVERANKEVMRHLRHIFMAQIVQQDYKLCIPLVQRIINASVHESIGVSPAQLLFGNAITLDRGIFLPQSELNSTDTINLSEWVNKMYDMQAKLLSLAREKQEKTNVYHIAENDIDESEVTVYPVNSYVLVDYFDRPPSKLHTQHKGPLRVVSFKDATYTLQDLVTGKLQKVHISKLRPFHFDADHTDPRKVAVADQQESDVEQILAHTRLQGNKKDMEFLVKWSDGGPNLWLPWMELRNNSKLHEYLIEQGKESLIPKQYRTK